MKQLFLYFIISFVFSLSFSCAAVLCRYYFLQLYVFTNFVVTALSHLSLSFFFSSPLQHCSGCGKLVALDSPVVYAERAGYERLWHPTCFACAECNEALVDLVYFWRKDTLLCGRHYCQGLKPRCPGCDEVIAFSHTD